MSAEMFAGVALLGAAACWLGLAAPDIPPLWRAALARAAQVLRIDELRVELTQAGLGRISPWVWLAMRWTAAVAAGTASWTLVGLAVVGLVAAIAAYHLAGLALESRHRALEARRQRALLDAIRFGISVMSRSGGALHMLEALRDGGPGEARPVFGQLLDAASARGNDLPGAVEEVRLQLADPLFDDVALALRLHWTRGGKLVPALEAVFSDWSDTLRLQREAKAARAGVEASVMVLTILPFLLLFLVRLAAPTLLAPLASPLGETVVGAAIGWMVIGYRLLQRMGRPPREERMTIDEAAL